MSIEASNKVANIYANALLDAMHGKAAESAFKHLTLLSEAFELSPRVFNVLKAPTTAADVKAKIIESLVESIKLDKKLVNFLLLLVKHKKLHLLKLITHKLEVKLQQLRGEQEVLVITAKKADKGWLEKLERQLSNLLDCKPLITNIEQPELLGGAIVAINSLRLDCSVYNQLNQLSSVARSALSKAEITL